MAETEPKAEIGDAMEDGTVFAGFDGVKTLYTTPSDAPLPYTFNEATEYGRQMNARKYLGHDDWRVPTRGELNVLWENRDEGKLKGTFNETGSNSIGWHWSSSQDDSSDNPWGRGLNAWGKRFDSGGSDCLGKNSELSLRLVRG